MYIVAEFYFANLPYPGIKKKGIIHMPEPVRIPKPLWQLIANPRFLLHSPL